MPASRKNVLDHDDAARGCMKSSQRIKVACDRCRMKKSRCDGKERCRLCIAHNTNCVYSTQSRRETRAWFDQIQDNLDEAIQRLYVACKRANVFPGTSPEMGEGRVTTESILHGMGLIKPKCPIRPSRRLRTVVSGRPSKADTTKYLRGTEDMATPNTPSPFIPTHLETSQKFYKCSTSIPQPDLRYLIPGSSNMSPGDAAAHEPVITDKVCTLSSSAPHFMHNLIHSIQSPRINDWPKTSHHTTPVHVNSSFLLNHQHRDHPPFTGQQVYLSPRDHFIYDSSAPHYILGPHDQRSFVYPTYDSRYQDFHPHNQIVPYPTPSPSIHPSYHFSKTNEGQNMSYEAQIHIGAGVPVLRTQYSPWPR